RLRRDDVVARRRHVRAEPVVTGGAVGRERRQGGGLARGRRAAAAVERGRERVVVHPARAGVAGERVVVVYVVVLGRRGHAERLRGGPGRLEIAADEGPAVSDRRDE